MVFCMSDLFAKECLQGVEGYFDGFLLPDAFGGAVPVVAVIARLDRAARPRIGAVFARLREFDVARFALGYAPEVLILF